MKNPRFSFIREFQDGIKCVIRDKSDAIAFFEIFFLDSYNFLKGFSINKNDVVIDIGAHIGYFTVFASKQAVQGKIYSFEPSSNSFKILKKNISINNLKNVFAENLGVLKNSGHATLFVNENYAITNSIFKNDKPEFSKEDISIISIPDIVKKYQINKIDFLKLDCEGSEYEIILNLPKDVLKKIVKISVEVHSNIENYQFNDLYDFLKANNFEVQKINFAGKSEHNLNLLFAKNKLF